jgi:polysaccharide biosynthesis protein PslH
MKILYIASRFPYPTLTGDRVRAYHQLRLLSQRHRLTLLSPIKSAEEYAGLSHIQSLCESVEVFPPSPHQRICNLMRIPFSSLPWQVTYTIDRRIKHRITQLLRRQNFDVLHTQLARTAPLVDELVAIPKVIDLIDALSLNMQRRAEQENPIMAWVAGREARSLKSYEQILLKKFDHAAVVSTTDRDAIGDFTNLHVIPNGVTPSTSRLPIQAMAAPEIIFSGNMSYFPNINAVQYFIDRVLPLVRRHFPKVRFTVIGANPSPQLQHQYPEIKFTGYVPQIYDYIAQATVAVAPMQSGSGIQNKILEAMAVGIPVVTTAYGMGGLGAKHNQDLLIANTAKDFAASVIALLQDQQLRQRIAVSAQQYIATHHSWEASVAVLENLYRDAIAAHQPFSRQPSPSGHPLILSQ